MAVTIFTIAVFSIVAFWKREWGLYLFVFLLPAYLARIELPLFYTDLTIALSLSELLFYILAVSVAARDWRALCAKMKELFANEKMLLLGMMYILAGVFVGVWQSNDAPQTLGILRGFVAAPMALFFIVRALKPDKEYIAGAFAASSAAAALVSFFAPHAFNADGRLQGFYGSPNYLAMYLAPLLPLALYAVFKTARGRKFFVISVLLAACFAVAATAVFFTFSQGAWLGALAAVAVAALWYAKTRFPTNTRAIVVAAFLIILLGEIVGQSFLREPVVSSLKSRVGLWEAAWNIGSSHPLFGIGAGTFPDAYKIQKHIVLYPVGLETALHPHNVFFAFWLYGGLLGILGFGLALFWLARNIYHNLTAKDQKNAMFYGALAAAFIIILTHGLVDTTYWKNDLAFMWWILMAML